MSNKTYTIAMAIEQSKELGYDQIKVISFPSSEVVDYESLPQLTIEQGRCQFYSAEKIGTKYIITWKEVPAL